MGAHVESHCEGMLVGSSCLTRREFRTEAEAAAGSTLRIREREEGANIFTGGQDKEKEWTVRMHGREM